MKLYINIITIIWLSVDSFYYIHFLIVFVILSFTRVWERRISCVREILYSVSGVEEATNRRWCHIHSLRKHLFNFVLVPYTMWNCMLPNCVCHFKFYAGFGEKNQPHHENNWILEREVSVSWVSRLPKSGVQAHNRQEPAYRLSQT